MHAPRAFARGFGGLVVEVVVVCAVVIVMASPDEPLVCCSMEASNMPPFTSDFLGKESFDLALGLVTYLLRLINCTYDGDQYAFN